jgi:hypothetical protein
MAHYKSVHKDDLIDDDSRTLLEMSFSRGVAGASDSTGAIASRPNHREPRITFLAYGPGITQALAFLPMNGDLILMCFNFNECLGNKLMRSSKEIQQLR